jgi:hypothetical protein
MRAYEQPPSHLLDLGPCSCVPGSHLYVRVQCLDVCSNACDQATTSNGHKDGVKLGWVCDLQREGGVGGTDRSTS